MAVVYECLMTEDCPGYDSDRRVCLIRPDDCEFAPADDEAAPRPGAPDAPTPDPSGDVEAR